MILGTIDQEKSFAERHRPLADEAFKALEAAHSKLLASPEYTEFEEQIKIFWMLLDEVPEEPEGIKDTMRKPVPDETFAKYFGKTEFLLRCYRPLSQHVRNPTYSLLQDGDTEFTAAGRIVAEVDKALGEYRAFCGRSEKHEESRRYRALCAIYIAPAYVHRYEVAKYEKISDSELCFDIIMIISNKVTVSLGASRILCKQPRAVQIEQIISREQLRFQELLPCQHNSGRNAVCQGSATQSGILSA